MIFSLVGASARAKAASEGPTGGRRGGRQHDRHLGERRDEAIDPALAADRCGVGAADRLDAAPLGIRLEEIARGGVEPPLETPGPRVEDRHLHAA